VDKGQTVTQTFILVFLLTEDSLKVDRTTMNVNGTVINMDVGYLRKVLKQVWEINQTDNITVF
jgi:hypothetical protein